MRHIVALFLLSLGLAAPAAAGPKVLIAGDDCGDGTLLDLQTALKAFNAFAAVDTFDASVGTPTLNQLKMYESVVNFDSCAYADEVAIGNVFADYVDAGGGLLVMNLSLDSGDFLDIKGRFGQGGYYCILPGQLNFLNTVTLKAMPNDAQ